MFARKQKLCAAIPMDPPSQCLLQEPLLEKSNETYANVHQHEKAEEDPSLVVVGSPVLANIQTCSFLLGLLIALFSESITFLVHVLTLAMFGNDTDRDMVTLFSGMLSGCITGVIIALSFFRALDRYYPSLDDPSGKKKKEDDYYHVRMPFRSRNAGRCQFGLDSDRSLLHSLAWTGR
jgi:hypothetical protein